MKRQTFSILFLLGLLAVAMGTAAQEPRVEPRSVSFSDSFALGSTQYAGLPDTILNTAINTMTMQTGEPSSSCAAGAELNSLWFSVILPHGTLVVDTTYNNATNFDSVVTVYHHSMGPIDTLVEAACADNSVGDKAVISAALPSGAYLVRVTCKGSCIGPTLTLQVRYETTKNAPNDTINNALPITVNKAVKSKRVAFATTGDENIALTCKLNHSVWYTFAAPSSGVYAFSTTGSAFLRPQGDIVDSKLAVYVSSSGLPIYADLTEEGCVDDTYGTLYGSMHNVFLTKGEVVYVRAGTFTAINMLPGSAIRVKVTAQSLSNLLDNSLFDLPLGPGQWVLKNPTAGDGLVDETSMPGNELKLNGAAGKRTKLKQVYQLAANGLALPQDSILRLQSSYSTNETIAKNIKVMLKIIYSDGTKTTAVSRNLSDFTGTGGSTLLLSARVASAKAVKVIVMVKAKNPAGMMYLDNVNLHFYGDATRNAKGLLPVPPAAN